MQDLRQICGLLAIALLCAGAAFSQAVNGTIVGTLTETNTRIAHTGLTNESGAYGFPELPLGTYEVAVEMEKEVESDVILEANSSPRVDLKLSPGVPVRYETMPDACQPPTILPACLCDRERLLAPAGSS